MESQQNGQKNIAKKSGINITKGEVGSLIFKTIIDFPKNADKCY